MTIQVEMELIQENQAEGYSVSRLGNLPLVVPFGVALSVEHGDQVVWAAGELAKGRDEAALAALARIQRDLGVTQDLHQAAVAAAGAQLAGKVRQARTAARAAQAQRLAAIPAPAVLEPNGSVNFNADEADKARARLRTAQVQVERARANGKRDQGALNARKAALADLRKYEDRAQRARQDQRDRAWAETVRCETQALAQARGEEVALEAVERGQARLRIKSRDGLAALYEAEEITQQQYDAGRAYRLFYETVAAGLKVANMQPSGGAPTFLELGRSAAELARAYSVCRLIAIHLVVCPDRRPNRALYVLQAVAGEGHSLRSLGAGNSREANLKALGEALDRAGAYLRKAPKKGLANQ